MDITMELFIKELEKAGGITRCGQPGFCMLYVLWNKACELQSLAFTMSNTEISYKAGFCRQKRFYEVRKDLRDKGFLKFQGIDGSKSVVFYELNMLFDEICDNESGNRIDSVIDSGMDNRTDNRTDSRIDSRTDNRINNRMDNRIDSGIDSGIDNRTDSRIDSRTDNRTDSRIDSRTDNRINNGMDNRTDSRIDSETDDRENNRINNRITGLRDMAISFSRRET